MIFQSSELDSMQELFDLLQIKCDVWDSSNRDDVRRHSDDSSDWTPMENIKLPIKKENEGEDDDDDEKEEGEIKDDEDDDSENNQEESNTSPNPVNLSLNTKSNSDVGKENDDSEVMLSSDSYI